MRDIRRYKLFTPEFWQSWQTAGIALALIVALFPYPSHFIYYVLGFCLGFALIHRLLLIPPKGVDTAFRYALPYMVLYGLMFVSCFFSDNISANLSYCGQYFCLWLIPLIFVGMTPSFFTKRRLRIFAFSLVVGVVIGVLWKFFVFYQICFSNRLMVYREQGLWVVFKYGYGYLQYFVKTGGYKLEHPAFEALFGLMALVVVLQSWIKKDVFFSHRYGKILAVFALCSIIINLLFFCTKMAALGCVLSVFALWVYALCKKRYVFASASAIGFLLLAGGLTFYAPEMVLSRFQHTAKAMKSFFNGENTETDSSFIPRIYTYKTGWEIFKEKPITGWSADFRPAFRQHYKKYLDKLPDRTWMENKISSSHNQLLYILDFCGIVGGLVFVWLFLCVLRDVWRRKSLFWWIWFAGLLAICTIEVLFNRTIGLIYLCGFHGILFCELTSDFLHPEDADKTRIPEKPAEGV